MEFQQIVCWMPGKHYYVNTFVQNFVTKIKYCSECFHFCSVYVYNMMLLLFSGDCRVINNVMTTPYITLGRIK